MAKSATSTVDRKVATDLAAIGYQSALQMIGYEGSIIWSAFTAILYANIAIYALLGALLTLFRGNFLPEVFVVFLSTCGFVVCYIWYYTLSRQFRYYEYWFSWARSHEYLLFSSDQEMIQCGAAFASGKDFWPFNSTTPISMPKTFPSFKKFSFFRVRHLMNGIIIIFAMIYFAVGAFVCIYNPQPADASSSTYLINQRNGG